MRSAFVLALLSFSGVGVAWSVGQQVKTTSGTFAGHGATQLPGTGDVSEYLGIRFGQPTSGSLRFMKPKKYESQASSNASSYGPACPFMIPPMPNLPPGVQLPSSNNSEDCLFVNVWTKPQMGEKKKAVMVWIYGGGFSFGDAANPMFNGARLAQDQDVVVVNLNYRTNIFGFPGAPGLPDSNLAFLDQRLALEWVRDNVEQFGGDVSRITLFGESAGGTSVDDYSYIWRKDPIVSAFIEESGTSLLIGPFGPQEPDIRAKYWFNMTTVLGCGGASVGTKATVACAQNATVKQIQDAMPKTTGFENTVGYFGPVFDGKTVFKDIFARADAGEFIRKPLLGGSNNNESLIFTLQGGTTPQIDIAINNGFRCGAAETAKARFKNHVPTWRYHYAATRPGSTMGAVHGQDVPLVYGDGSALSKVVQGAWAAFAKDPQKGLVKYGWPEYNPKGKTLIRLGYNGAVQPDFVQADTYDGTCTSYAPVHA